MDGSVIRGEKAAKTPPYISYATLKTFIADLHDHRIPSRIDRSIMTRFSGTAQKQLMTALRFLDLIDADGKPTDALHALAKTYGTNEWPSALGAVIKKAYAPLFEIDLATATPQHFSETFGNAFSNTEAVMRKCIAFFLPAASEAGIQISDRILKGKKPRLSSSARPRPTRRPAASAGNGSKSAASQNPPPPPPPSSAVVPPTAFQLTAMLDPAMTDEERQAVWTLIQYSAKREAAAAKK